MDRQLSKEYRNKRKRKWIISIISALAFLGSSYAFIPRLLQSSVRLENFEVGEVSRGALQLGIETIGYALPISEALIISPVTTNVQVLYKQVGDTLQPNDIILKLDSETEQLHLSKLNDELKLLEGNIEKKRLEELTNKLELHYQLVVDSIELEQMKADIAKEEELNRIGGSSRETIAKLKNKQKVAMLANQKRKRGSAIQLQMSKLKMQELQLNRSIQQAAIRTQEKKVKACDLRSFGKGVLTELNCQLGQKTPEGMPLAKVADLEHFKILGKVPNRYTSDMRMGQEVIIRYDTMQLVGQVSGIVPSDDNGSIEFTVHYGSQKATGLLANMRVKLHVVKTVNTNSLRLPYGSYYDGKQTAYFYVLQNGQLHKRKVRLGGASDTHVEVLEGLKLGEQVVLNSKLAQQYPHSDVLKINE